MNPNSWYTRLQQENYVCRKGCLHDSLAADVSRDGHVTSLDALIILQVAAGAIEL